MIAVRGSPPRKKSLRTVHRQFAGARPRGPLADADPDEERFVAVGRDGRDHAGKMRAERKREAARLPDLAIHIDRPGRIIDDKIGRLPACGQDAVADVVARRPQLVVVPDAEPAGAARRTDIVEVQAFAAITVLVAAAQLAIGEGPAHILAPRIDSRARGRFRRFERMAVNPVRGAIILPQ